MNTRAPNPRATGIAASAEVQPTARGRHGGYRRDFYECDARHRAAHHDLRMCVRAHAVVLPRRGQSEGCSCGGYCRPGQRLHRSSHSFEGPYMWRQQAPPRNSPRCMGAFEGLRGARCTHRREGDLWALWAVGHALRGRETAALRPPPRPLRGGHHLHLGRPLRPQYF